MNTIQEISVAQGLTGEPTPQLVGYCYLGSEPIR